MDERIRKMEKIVAEGKKEEIAKVLGVPERIARKLTKKDLQDTFFFFKNYQEDKKGEAKSSEKGVKQ